MARSYVSKFGAVEPDNLIYISQIWRTDRESGCIRLNGKRLRTWKAVLTAQIGRLPIKQLEFLPIAIKTMACDYPESWKPSS